MKIFVVEDDKSLVKMMENQLSAMRIKPLFRKFRCGLDEFLMIQPDLVLLDVNLPYYDGFIGAKNQGTFVGSNSLHLRP